jgi:hypothetical protein
MRSDVRVDLFQPILSTKTSVFNTALRIKSLDLSTTGIDERFCARPDLVSSRLTLTLSYGG